MNADRAFVMMTCYVFLIASTLVAWMGYATTVSWTCGWVAGTYALADFVLVGLSRTHPRSLRRASV